MEKESRAQKYTAFWIERIEPESIINFLSSF